jgi:hypothetical protein
MKVSRFRCRQLLQFAQNVFDIKTDIAVVFLVKIAIEPHLISAGITIIPVTSMILC